MNDPTKQKNTVPYLYLFSGQAELDPESGKIDPTSESFDLLKNRIVFTKEEVIIPKRHLSGRAELREGEKYTAWFTNGNGVLQMVAKEGFGAGAGKVTKEIKPREFLMPPRQIALQTMYSEKEGWADYFHRFFRNNPDVGFTRLSVMALTWDKFRKPDLSNHSDSEKKYSKWYTNIKQKNQTVFGYVLLRSKAIVFVFSSKIYAESYLIVETPDGEISDKLYVEKTENGTTSFAAAMQGIQLNELNSGLYKFKVVLSENLKKDNFSKSLYNEKTNKYSYEFVQQIDFGIKNEAGEFDLVCCDPISIEESMLTSFSTSYPHLVQAVKEREQYVDEKQTRNDENRLGKLPESLLAVADRMSWTGTKAKLFLELIDADGGYAKGWVLGNAIFSGIYPQNQLDVHVRDTISFVFTVKQGIGTWNDFVKKLKTKRFDPKKFDWIEEINDARLGEYFVKGARLEKMRRVLSESKAGEQVKFLKVNTEKFIGKIKGIKNVGHAIVWLDAFISASFVVRDLGKVSDKSDNKERKETILFRKAEDYIQDFGETTFNRQAMGEIEQAHIAAILERAGVDDALTELAESSFWAILATACVIPATQVPALFIAVIAGVYAIGVAGFNMLDSFLFDSRFQESDKHTDMLCLLADISEQNRNLLKELDRTKESHRLLIQVCIRYEAVAGLVRLLTMAGLTAFEEKVDYQSVVSEFKIDQYLERYILQDGWIINKDGFNPIGLDEDWYYENRLNENDLYHIDDHAEHGFQWFNDSKESGSADKNVKAAFQSLFPIHFTNSPTSKDLTQNFQTIYSDIDEDCIDSVAVYFRKEYMTDELAPKRADQGWIKVVPGRENAILPLDQVRILVVLKPETPKGVYPIKIRLHRVDGWNITGPEYFRFTHELEPFLLDSEKPVWSESTVDGKKVKRIGAVFYPFYYLARERILGIKPLARDILSPERKYKMKLFSNMRYQIGVTVGAGLKESIVDLCRIDKKSVVYHDDNRISVKIDIDDRNLPLFVGSDGKSHEYARPHFEKMKKMLNAGFLALKTSEFRYPVLFDSTFSADKGAGPFYIRYSDKGPYQFCEPGEVIIPEGGDCWNRPVELILIIWSRKEKTRLDRYEELGMSTEHLPLTARLINYEGKDTKGPKICTSLTRLGVFENGPTHGNGPLFTKKTDTDKFRNLKPLVDLLESQKSERARVSKQIGYQFTNIVPYYDSGAFELFAAHFRMTYDLEDGTIVNGVRPFSESLFGDNRIKWPGYYRYGFTDIVMADNIGLNVPIVSGINKKAQRAEYEFHFQAPEDYSQVKQWEKIEDIDKWIGEVPELLDAGV